jgi:hypothetical protein
MSKTPGMVKVARVNAMGNIEGKPEMVQVAQVKTKQQAGFKVIGEDSSAGASSAGGMAAGGFGNGFLNGGPGAISRRPKKKKTTETTVHDKNHAGPYDCGGSDSWYGRRFAPHKYVDLPNGNRQKVELTDPAEIAAYKAGYENEGGQGKDYGESVAEGANTLFAVKVVDPKTGNEKTIEISALTASEAKSKVAGKWVEVDGEKKHYKVVSVKSAWDESIEEDITDEGGPASRSLCLSKKSNSQLGASQLASCKSQGLRAREGDKSHKFKDGKRVTVGGHKIKGKAHGGPLPDWGSRGTKKKN